MSYLRTISLTVSYLSPNVLPMRARFRTQHHAHAMQIYTDAALAKINFRWRTALIVRPSRLLPPCISLIEPPCQ